MIARVDLAVSSPDSCRSDSACLLVVEDLKLGVFRNPVDASEEVVGSALLGKSEILSHVVHCHILSGWCPPLAGRAISQHAFRRLLARKPVDLLACATALIRRILAASSVVTLHSRQASPSEKSRNGSGLCPSPFIKGAKQSTQALCLRAVASFLFLSM